MIAKLCAWAPTRAGAVAGMAPGAGGLSHRRARAQHRLPLRGDGPGAVRLGPLSTRYIVDEFPDGFHGLAVTPEQSELMVAVAGAMHLTLSRRARDRGGHTAPERSRFVVVVDDDPRGRSDGRRRALTVILARRRAARAVEIAWRPGDALFRGELDGRPFSATVARAPEGFVIRHRAARAKVLVLTPTSADLHKRLPKKTPPDTSRLVVAPMPGLVVSMDVGRGRGGQVRSGHLRPRGHEDAEHHPRRTRRSDQDRRRESRRQRRGRRHPRGVRVIECLECAQEFAMKFEFVPPTPPPRADTVLAVPAFEGALGSAAAALDQQLGGMLAKAVAGSRFTGGAGQTLDWWRRTASTPRGCCWSVWARWTRSTPWRSNSAPPTLSRREGEWRQDADAAAAERARARSSRAPRSASSWPPIASTNTAPPKRRTRSRRSTTVQFAVDDPAAAQAAFEQESGLADAVIFARDLVSEPANILYPAEFARRVKELERLGLEVEILGEDEMTKLGMGALLGRGAGQSPRKPARRHSVEGRGRSGRPADRLRGQGRLLRHRRHQHQAGRRHGGDDHRHGRRRRGDRPDVRPGLAQGEGQRRRHPRPRREHAGRQRPAPRRYRHQHVRPDHRGHQHRRRRPPRPRRRALVLSEPLQAEVHGRSGDPDGAIIVSLGKDIAGLFSNDDDSRPSCSRHRPLRASRCGGCRCRRSTTDCSTRRRRT